MMKPANKLSATIIAKPYPIFDPLGLGGKPAKPFEAPNQKPEVPFDYSLYASLIPPQRAARGVLPISRLALALYRLDLGP